MRKFLLLSIALLPTVANAAPKHDKYYVTPLKAPHYHLNRENLDGFIRANGSIISPNLIFDNNNFNVPAVGILCPTPLAGGQLQGAPLTACNFNNSGSGSTAPYSGTPAPCTTSTVGTSPTLMLDSVANNTGRAAGGIQVPLTATAPIEYQWSNSSSGLTTTPGGIVYQVAAGQNIPFYAAQNTQLWAISTASQAVSCQYSK